MKRPEIVEQIRKIVHHVVPDATTILYGSEARGDARADSDIDLLVLLDGERLDWERQEKVAAPLYDIELNTGVQISPTIMLRKHWENRPFKTPFYVNVMNEGIVL